VRLVVFRVELRRQQLSWRCGFFHEACPDELRPLLTVARETLHARGLYTNRLPIGYDGCLGGGNGCRDVLLSFPPKVCMKSQSPALTQAALVATAGRKAQKVQRKLKQAETELHTANEILVKAVPTRDKQDIDSAVQQNIAAEEKVHDAAEELQVVKELLSDVEAGAQGTSITNSTGQSGDGVKSLIPHLERNRSRATE
jgi:hypothetical protein